MMLLKLKLEIYVIQCKLLSLLWWPALGVKLKLPIYTFYYYCNPFYPLGDEITQILSSYTSPYSSNQKVPNSSKSLPNRVPNKTEEGVLQSCINTYSCLFIQPAFAAHCWAVRHRRRRVPSRRPGHPDVSAQERQAASPCHCARYVGRQLKEIKKILTLPTHQTSIL